MVALVVVWEGGLVVMPACFLKEALRFSSCSWSMFWMCRVVVEVVVGLFNVGAAVGVRGVSSAAAILLLLAKRVVDDRMMLKLGGRIEVGRVTIATPTTNDITITNHLLLFILYGGQSSKTTTVCFDCERRRV